MVGRTLDALNKMQITFPGKSEKAMNQMLDKVGVRIQYCRVESRVDLFVI